MINYYALLMILMCVYVIITYLLKVIWRIKFHVKKFTKTKLQEMIKDQESQYKAHRIFCKNVVEKISKSNKDDILLNSLLEELVIWLKDNKILFNEPIPSSKVIE
jgi:hypothetical protein